MTMMEDTDELPPSTDESDSHSHFHTNTDSDLGVGTDTNADTDTDETACGFPNGRSHGQVSLQSQKCEQRLGSTHMRVT